MTVLAKQKLHLDRQMRAFSKTEKHSMTIIHDEPPRYQSYVLRCWEMRSQHPDRPATWRFSLEDSQTREKHAFSGLEPLVAFLQTELEEHEGEKKTNEEIK